MEKYSKAIAAGAGGGLVGTGALPFVPEGTPWYGYAVIYAISIALPAIITLLAPANK